jgi:hypothetical protein
MKILYITTLIFYVCFCSSCTDERQKLGEEIISKIETYKKVNGRLPNQLNDIGIIEKEEGPIYYTKQNDTTYIIYYGLGLGESMVYDFRTKKWKSDGG